MNNNTTVYLLLPHPVYIFSPHSLPSFILSFFFFSFLFHFLASKMNSCFIFYINKYVIEPLTCRTGSQEAKQ